MLAVAYSYYYYYINVIHFVYSGRVGVKFCR